MILMKNNDDKESILNIKVQSQLIRLFIWNLPHGFQKKSEKLTFKTLVRSVKIRSAASSKNCWCFLDVSSLSITKNGKFLKILGKFLEIPGKFLKIPKNSWQKMENYSKFLKILENSSQKIKNSGKWKIVSIIHERLIRNNLKTFFRFSFNQFFNFWIKCSKF